MKWFFQTGTLVLLFVTSISHAGEQRPVVPAKNDKCPVCGMFVVKYPDFVAEILFKDGSHAVFDGAKDMFKYYFDLQKYNPKKKQTDVDSIYVTDYYNLTLIDGFEAYYVIGSDVYGPMGRELIPHETIQDAEEFLKDHNGKSIIRFTDITNEIIQSLD